MKFRSLLYASAALLALAGPAFAQTWNAPANTGLQNGKSSPIEQFLVHYFYDGAGDAVWQAGFAPDSTTDFNADMFTANNCPVLGSASSGATITSNVAKLSIEWETYTTGNIAEGERGVLRITGENTSQAITRTEIQAGRPVNNSLRIKAKPGWYWKPSQSGIGYNVDFQGDSLFLGIFACTAAGKPTWFISTGAMTSLYQYDGRLQHWSKASGTPVATDLGAISVRWYLENDAFPDTYRLDLTLPDGQTFTLQPYTR